MYRASTPRTKVDPLADASVGGGVNVEKMFFFCAWRLDAGRGNRINPLLVSFGHRCLIAAMQDPEKEKADRDNRANQLNKNNPAYASSRQGKAEEYDPKEWIFDADFEYLCKDD